MVAFLKQPSLLATNVAKREKGAYPSLPSLRRPTKVGERVAYLASLRKRKRCKGHNQRVQLPEENGSRTEREVSYAAVAARIRRFLLLPSLLPLGYIRCQERGLLEEAMGSMGRERGGESLREPALS